MTTPVQLPLADAKSLLNNGQIVEATLSADTPVVHYADATERVINAITWKIDNVHVVGAKRTASSSASSDVCTETLAEKSAEGEAPSSDVCSEKFAHGDDEGLSQQITYATERIGALRAFLEVLENKYKYQESVRSLALDKFHYPNFPQHCSGLLDDIMGYVPEFRFYWFAGTSADIPTAVIAKKIEAYKKEIDEAVASLEVLLLIKEYRELCVKRDQVSAKLSARALETKTDLRPWFNGNK